MLEKHIEMGEVIKKIEKFLKESFDENYPIEKRTKTTNEKSFEVEALIFVENIKPLLEEIMFKEVVLAKFTYPQISELLNRIYYGDSLTPEELKQFQEIHNGNNGNIV